MGRDRSKRALPPSGELRRTGRRARARAVPLRERNRSTESDGLPASVLFGLPPVDPLRRVIVLNARGGLTIPRAMRRSLALDPGGRLVAETTPDGVLLRPALRFPFDPLDPRQARTMLALDMKSVDRFLRKRRKR